MKKFAAVFAALATTFLVAMFAVPTANAATVNPSSMASTQASANAAYNSFKSTMTVPTGWTGNVSSCSAGTVSTSNQDAVFQAVNYFRSMAGVGSVKENASLSSQAQQSALITAAALARYGFGLNGASPHQPPMSWPCYNATGAAASGASNLFMSSALTSNAGLSIASYMNDSDSGNAAVVGHRQWVLDPLTTLMGSGSTSTSQTLYVINTGSKNSAASSPDIIPWPSAGFFPAPLLDRLMSSSTQLTAWSVQSARATFSGASVSVTKNGTPVTGIATRTPTTGYGDGSALIWQMPSISLPASGQIDTYHVTISGVRGVSDSTYTYDVKVYNPSDPILPSSGSSGPLPSSTSTSTPPTSSTSASPTSTDTENIPVPPGVPTTLPTTTTTSPSGSRSSQSATSGPGRSNNPGSSTSRSTSAGSTSTAPTSPGGSTSTPPAPGVTATEPMPGDGSGIAPDVTPNSSGCDPSCNANGSDGYVMTINVVDASGKPIVGAAGQLQAAAGAGVTFSGFTDLGNGNYAVTVNATAGGTFTVDVTLNGASVGSSAPLSFIGVSVAKPKINVGAVQTFTAAGFKPLEWVTVTLHSAPINVGRFQADANGVITVKYTLPSNLAAGAHTVDFAGEQSGTATQAFTVTTGLNVQTGGGIAGPVGAASAAAIMLILAGLALLMVRRQRSIA